MMFLWGKINMMFQVFIILACNITYSNAQDQVVFNITKVPDYTPETDSLFLCASLSDWKLNEKSNLFRRLPDGTYRLVIHLEKNQEFEFKINRGSWKKVEGNDVGGFYSNRYFVHSDSIYEYNMVVKSWQDLHHKFFPPVTIKVISIPANTPTDASIFIAGSFNGWNCLDPDYKMSVQTDGTYQCEIKSGMDRFEYKFSRGTWASAEARWDGGLRSNREFIAEEGKTQTIITKIHEWSDISRGQIWWKIIFFLLGIQSAISIYFLIRIKKSKIIVGMVSIILLAFILMFLYNNNAFSQYFIKGMFLPGCLFSSICPLVYIGLKNYNTNKFKNVEITFLLISLPFLVFVYLFQLTDEELSLKAIEFDISVLHMSIYLYALCVNNIFIYKTINYLKNNQGIENIEIIKKMINALRFLILFTSCEFILGIICLTLDVDIKLIVDWYENTVWVCIGLLVFYGQLLVLEEAGHIIRQKPKVIAKHSNSDSGWELLKVKLTSLMEEDELYLNPKLTLNDLARHLGSNTYYVSKVLNQGFETSFTDYVNSYRLKAFINDFKSTNKGDDTILHCAYKSGFNSKSAFNRAFKKSTGTTPSEYFSKEPAY